MMANMSAHNSTNMPAQVTIHVCHAYMVIAAFGSSAEKTTLILSQSMIEPKKYNSQHVTTKMSQSICC